jgi:methylamine dehydrogenase accessory protein MauD
MDAFLLGIQLLLAVVFATAGATKLLDQQGSRGALRGFGVSERVAPVAGLLLPLIELATAVALVLHPSARWGGVAALVLLLAFGVAIAAAMARGEAPDCHCFGQLHSAPAGRGTLARNAVLGLLAGVLVVAGPGPALDDWVAGRTAAELWAVSLGVAAAVLGVACARLWLDNRGLRRDLAREREATELLPPGLPVGATAPGFTLPDVTGETVSLDALLARGRPVALLFVGPSCAPCATLLPELGRWQASLANRLTIALVGSGSVEDNLRMAEEHGLGSVLVQEGSEVLDAYRVSGTPAAVMLTPEGRIASVAGEGVHAIEPLIRLALRDGTPTPADGNGARPEQRRVST